ncbi:MAG: hypothetical protein ACK5GN_07700 [Pseudomonadota bacterium]|jgi:hypothetical protein
MTRNKALVAMVIAVTLFALTPRTVVSQQECDAAQYQVNYSQRQVNTAQTRLYQQQNALVSLQNRIDSRTLSLQSQVDQARAWQQSAAGLNVGSTVGCTIRTIFWGGGRCFANSVSQIFRIRARADAQYNLAVSRLNNYNNLSSQQLARKQQEVAQAQLQYDSAVSKFQLSEKAYLDCVNQQAS